VLSLLLVGVSYGITPTQKERDMSRAWVHDNLLAEKTTMPFSFSYDGTHSSRLLPLWKKTEKLIAENDEQKEYVLTFSDPRGVLEVRCIVKEYLDYPSAEWTVFFENISSNESSLLKYVHAADFDLRNKTHGNYCLYYAEGSDHKVTDFQPLRKDIAYSQTVDLACYGGRSSDGHLPFFNIETPDRYGIVLGIGWTGQWAVKCSYKKKKSLNIRAGMEKLRTKLLPGETIRTPAIMISFWRNDRMRGHNILRSLLREHYSPGP
jgi:alpha-galactosidase